MKIREIHIDAFGALRNTHLTGLSGGLNVLTGENEAGKSTLLAFIRSVFFGYPTGREENSFEPAGGGRAAGRLLLTLEDGEEALLERVAGPKGGRVSLARAGGQAEGAESLHFILGGASRELYRSIFAFGLGELQQFESINQECVRDIIYSAGLGLGGKGLTFALAELEKRMSSLYLHGGRNQPLRRAQQEAERAADEALQIANGVDEYDRLGSELRTAEAEAEELSIEEKKQQNALALLRDRRRARAAWEAILQARARLAATPLSDTLQDLLRAGAAIEACERERGEIRSALEETPRLLSQLEREEEVLADSLRKINPAWSLSDACAFDTSSGPRSEVESFQLRLTEEQTLLREAENRCRLLQGEEETLRRKIELRAKTESTPSLPETFDVAEEGRRIEEIIRIHRSLREEEIRLEILSERIVDLTAEEARHLRQGHPQEWRLPLPAALLALCGIALLWILHRQAGLSAALITAIPLLIAAAGWATLINHRLTRERTKSEAEALQRVTTRLHSLESVEASHREAVRTLERRRDEVLHALGRAASPLGDSLIAELQSSWEGRRESLRVAARQREETEALRVEQDTLRSRHAAEANRTAEIRIIREAILSSFQEWLVKKGLSASLTPPAALATMEDIFRLHERHARCKVQREALQAKEEKISRFCLSVADLAGLKRRPDMETDPRRLLLELDRLVRELHLAEEVVHHRRELEAGILQAEVQFECMGTRELRSAVMEESPHSVEELLLREEELEKRILSLRSALTETWNRLGALETERKRLATEERHRACRERRATAEEEIGQGVKRWTAAAIAREIMLQARSRYEQERQPGVIRSASDFFATLTGRRYRRILSPPGGGPLEVEENNGTRHPLSHLSRGTAEQLYFAIRLGLIREYSRHNPGLPIVMDDILVNFDPVRAARAAQAISELAQSSQIFFFTCHPYPGPETPRVLTLQ